MVQELDLKKKKLMSIVIMIIIMLLTLILMITTFTLEYMYGSHHGDGSILINIDTDNNGKPDVNIDYDKDGEADINVDTDGDGKPDENLTNTDSNGNGKADINVDTDSDGYPDVNIDIDGDGIPDVNIDSNIDKYDEQPQVDALATMMMSKSVNLYVSNADLSKSNVGNQNYISIDSEEETATISLKSNADTTNCNYSIIYNNEYNYFENKYTLSDGSLGTLKNQLLLEINGYNMVGNKLENISKTFDLVELKESEIILFENMMISDKKDNKTTNLDWKIKLSFRNYRDFDQINNGGKKAKGTLVFRMEKCERTK